MAKAKLGFKSSGSIECSIGSWRAFKKHVGDEFVEIANSGKSVYIIRLYRPFALVYPEGKSPVTYIGRGDFQIRITNHIRNWITPIGKSLSDSKWEVLVSTPKARNNVSFYKDVEADMIYYFEEKFGAIPLNNSKREYSYRDHQYDEAEINSAFGLGKGKKYHWGLTPIGSNPLRHKAAV